MLCMPLTLQLWTIAIMKIGRILMSLKRGCTIYIHIPSIKIGVSTTNFGMNLAGSQRNPWVEMYVAS